MNYPVKGNLSSIEYIENMYEFGGMWTKIYRKSIFKDYNIKFPDGFDSAEDIRTNVQLFYFAKKVEKISKHLYYYIRTRNESITGLSINKSTRVKTDFIENVKAIESFFIEKNIEQQLKFTIVNLKFLSKLNLLINAISIKTLRIWKNIFPEINNTKYILKKARIPFYYKIVALSVTHNIWIIPRIWVAIKKYYLLIKT